MSDFLTSGSGPGTSPRYPLCADPSCTTCQHRIRRFLRGAPAPICREPTKEALERHVRRFGTDGVAEVASEHGIVLKSVSRRVRGDLGADVVRLRALGYVPGAIADHLGTSERRVRQLLRQTRMVERKKMHETAGLT